jgi:hypothetical protein
VSGVSVSRRRLRGVPSTVGVTVGVEGGRDMPVLDRSDEAKGHGEREQRA